MAKIEGSSVLLPDGRYPYDGVAANAVWPVTVSDFKSHAQIGHAFEDGLLSSDFGGYLIDAVEEVEARGQISLIYQKRRLVLDRLPCEETIYAIRGPLVSVDEIRYLDADDVSTVLAPSYYRAEMRSKRGGVYFKDTSAIEVAEGDGSVWIDMTCGLSDDPAKIPAQWREVVRIIATHTYQRRERVSGGGLDAAWERVINRKIDVAGGSMRYV